MKFDGIGENAQNNALLYQDNTALAKIKHSQDKEGALKIASGQFEAMFLQMVLRQMRSSSDILADKDSPFSSKNNSVFRDMYDGQMAMEMAKRKSAGIADMLVKQLSPSVAEVQVTNHHQLSTANDSKMDIGAVLLQPKDRAQTDAVNTQTSPVASIEQGRHDMTTATAFTQPLNRKMEL